MVDFVADSTLEPKVESFEAHKAVPRTAIAYVTRFGFALPSAASALQVRRQVPASMADIYIICIGLAERSIGVMEEVLQQRGIKIATLSSERYNDFNKHLFNKTHVPISCLGRFFLTESIPDCYDRILYLDGDVVAKR